MKETYKKQVALLLDTLPEVAREQLEMLEQVLSC
jgi:hypothetical protein